MRKTFQHSLYIAWRTIVRAGTGIAVVLALAAMTAGAQTNTATTPVPRDPNAVPQDPHWLERHQSFLDLARQGNIDILFIGDSITDFWRSANPAQGGKAVWDATLAPLHAANFGIGADRTQHVLWRIEHGELDGISPRVVVLMIGTNNIGFERDRPTVRRNTTAQAIEGITAVVRAIQAKLPHTKIILMALLPRGEKGDPVRDQVREVNQALAGLADGKSIELLNIGAKFLYPDKSIRTDLMPDLLHPSEAGYRIWADALRGPVQQARQ